MILLILLSESKFHLIAKACGLATSFRPVVALTFALALAVTFSPMALFAADDGRVGEKSKGELEISLSILPSVQIETVDDVRLDIIDRTIDTIFSESFCVKGHSETRYTVVAAGSSNDSNAFTLRNQNGEILNYQVGYRGRAADILYDELKSGTPSSVYPVIDNNQPCREGAAIQITFRSQDLQKVGSGLFSGSLTLLVSPL